MTSLAQYEKKEGVKDLRINRYSCSDYVRMETMKVGVALVVALLLLSGIIIIFQIENVISDAERDHRCTGNIDFILFWNPFLLLCKDHPVQSGASL